MCNRIGESCWFRRFDTKSQAMGRWEGGALRAWSTDYEEFEAGPGLYPVGVVESDSSGLCHSVPVHSICFAAIPPE